MAASNNFFSGITDMLILYFLRQKDCYGYEMTKAISELSEGLLNISINTIYTSIYKMENDGLISEYSKLVGKRRTRVYYHLEPAGITHLEKLLFAYHSMVSGVEKITGKAISEENSNDVT
ncbi:MAG: PadR family transcriptional regulator [Lachnospiraceae bacterium]|jgi:PadR family transcriptional regulator PadR|nr:PadR family transcriptional regulator [Lachnospiraceae bacterium]MBR6150423.1 PadR family transcriptional regulator [Lachnospiraceae bacterium]